MDTEPFRLGSKDDYESVGYTLFNYLVQATSAEGYYVPKFFHWENWYNNKCTPASGMTRTVDRWQKRNKGKNFPDISVSTLAMIRNKRTDYSKSPRIARK